MTTLMTHHNYWLHTQDKNHHESQLNNRFLYLTGSNFGLETIGKRARENAVETEKEVPKDLTEVLDTTKIAMVGDSLGRLLESLVCFTGHRRTTPENSQTD